MAQLFVSYSRIDLPFVKHLAERIQLAFPDLKIWRDDAPHGLIGGDNWWETILKAVADSDVFLYVLSNESVQSVYCQAEFTEARRLQKRIITIQARDKTELTDELDDIQFIDMTRGIDDVEAFLRLSAAINKQLSLAKPKRPLWKTVTPKPRKEVPPVRPADSPDVETAPLERPTAEQEALRLARSGVRWQIIGVVLSVVLGVAALALAAIPLMRDGSSTPIVQASSPPPQTDTPSPTFTATAPPTISSFEQLQTAQMQLTLSAATQAAANLTATQILLLDANATATAHQIAATNLAARATLMALSATPTPSPTNTMLPLTSTASFSPTPTTTPIHDLTVNQPVTGILINIGDSGTQAQYKIAIPIIDYLLNELMNNSNSAVIFIITMLIYDLALGFFSIVEIIAFPFIETAQRIIFASVPQIIFASLTIQYLFLAPVSGDLPSFLAFPQCWGLPIAIIILALQTVVYLVATRSDY